MFEHNDLQRIRICTFYHAVESSSAMYMHQGIPAYHLLATNLRINVLSMDFHGFLWQVFLLLSCSWQQIDDMFTGGPTGTMGYGETGNNTQGTQREPVEKFHHRKPKISNFFVRMWFCLLQE